MITRDIEQFLARFGQLPATHPASCEAAFLISPAGFRVNPESGVDNHYLDLATPVDAALAGRQHADLVAAIRAVGVPTVTMASRPETPDAVFPNNVFAFADGRAVIGRMRHPTRELEAQRDDIRRFFTHGLKRELVDLSGQALVAELTGPLIIDRARRVGFCGMSERVDQAGLAAMHAALGLELTLQFDLAPGEYHTNVVLSILASRACVVHADSIADQRVVGALEQLYPTRRLTDDEKAGFVGNCLAVSERAVFMSDTAAQAMLPQTREFLTAQRFDVHAVAVGELERAGGSVRCMICEVF